MLKTKSVHTKIERSDGLRVLVARYRGRGLPADRYDVWVASLGPSEELLRSFLSERVSWSEFQRRYKAEMDAPSEVDRKSKTIKNHGQKWTMRLLAHLANEGDFTLLCHCDEDERQCHRHILASLIERA